MRLLAIFDPSAVSLEEPAGSRLFAHLNRSTDLLEALDFTAHPDSNPVMLEVLQIIAQLIEKIRNPVVDILLLRLEII